MSKAKKFSRDTASGQIVQGRAVATLSRGMTLGKVGKLVKQIVPPQEATTVLVKKAARALNKPGIDKSVVFRGQYPSKIFSYSVYPQDTSKIIRQDSKGLSILGRLVAGRFRAIKA